MLRIKPDIEKIVSLPQNAYFSLSHLKRLSHTLLCRNATLKGWPFEIGGRLPGDLIGKKWTSRKSVHSSPTHIMH
jgi:hypothetical protein